MCAHVASHMIVCRKYNYVYYVKFIILFTIWLSKSPDLKIDPDSTRRRLYEDESLHICNMSHQRRLLNVFYDLEWV